MNESVEGIECATVKDISLFLLESLCHALVASNLSLFLLSFEQDFILWVKGEQEFVGDSSVVNSFYLDVILVSHVRFLMVFAMVLLFDEFVDTGDFFAIKSVFFTIIFVNETIEIVVLSVPHSFGSSCLLSLFFSSKFSVKGGLFVLLCLFLLHGIFILSHLSMMMFMTFVFDIQKLVDSANLHTVAMVPASAIVFMNKTIECVELSFEFRFFIDFFGCCSLSGGSVSSINCISLVGGVRLSLVSFKLFLFGISLGKTVFICFLDMRVMLSDQILWLRIFLLKVVSINHSVTIAADLHGTRSRICSEEASVSSV